MLKTILSITGKPGLFKILSHSSKNLIVEDITSKKRLPVSMRDKVVSLGDIAMYTVSDDKPLDEVLELVYNHQGGEPVDVKGLIKEGGLRTLFGEIMPDYDEDRVRDSDIKKLFTWYNTLIGAGITKFKEEPEEKKDEKESEKTEASKE